MVQQLNTACLVIIVVFEVIGTIFCLGRLAARLVSATPWRGLMMWITKIAHLGYHSYDVVKFQIDIPTEMKWSMFDSLCYNPILGMIKASMILLYLRLGGIRTGVRIASYVLLAINFGLIISIFLVDMFQCVPFRYNFYSTEMDLAAQKAAGATDPGIGPYGPVTTGFKDGKYVKGGRCIDSINFLLITAGLTIVTDLLILCIPIYMVRGLKMEPRKKIAVLVILCMGIGVTAVGVTRLVFTYYAFHPTSPDSSYNVNSTISQIETGLALVTGCVPDLLPLVRFIFPRLLHFTDGHQPTTKPSAYPTTIGSKTVNRRNKSDLDEDEEIGLRSLKLRPDRLVQSSTMVRGAASVESLTREQSDGVERDDKSESQIVIVTTHFSVRDTEQHGTPDAKKSWSNV
ncbi:cfem domain-containing protein [Rutstroemia sp. NJR-2017a WRK4]|nr:cfem domain-containing protein [Rutstroemia sp. NJR-2017a BBW]PQE31495.1 cfem domain-containing protein [Rutstroemia sp. NJR-2017a WRK4]